MDPERSFSGPNQVRKIFSRPEMAKMSFQLKLYKVLLRQLDFFFFFEKLLIIFLLQFIKKNY